MKPIAATNHYEEQHTDKEHIMALWRKVSKPIRELSATQAPTMIDSIHSPSTPTPSIPKRTKAVLYDKLGLTIALVASSALGLFLWFAGAFFTLAAFKAVGINTNSIFWWLLPIGITAIELWLMPRKGQKPASVAIFAVILALDVASSWYGLLDVLAGRFIPLGAGFTIPNDGEAMHIGAILFSLVFAFAPEKIGRWAFGELRKLWS